MAEWINKPLKAWVKILNYWQIEGWKMQGWINEWMHTSMNKNTEDWMTNDFDEWIKWWFKRMSKWEDEWIK